ncbi:hypothetical protein H5410_045917 [Solanum commersonii]|uniref:Uncharacterized protein n=1 Tax=Solanum commersonii TaxID=4109 RepID=A0A9J5XAV5_SOLCO|nr:hypothetical protein H5410_045917 [Solanum commersonii]
MGVRNIETQNQCLMMKWLWRFASREVRLTFWIIRIDGKLYQLAFDGMLGQRNLRCHQNKINSIQKMKMKCLVLFHFLCKREYMEYLE